MVSPASPTLGFREVRLIKGGGVCSGRAREELLVVVVGGIMLSLNSSGGRYHAVALLQTFPRSALLSSPSFTLGFCNNITDIQLTSLASLVRSSQQ